MKKLLSTLAVTAICFLTANAASYENRTVTVNTDESGVVTSVDVTFTDYALLTIVSASDISCSNGSTYAPVSGTFGVENNNTLRFTPGADAEMPDGEYYITIYGEAIRWRAGFNTAVNTDQIDIFFNVGEGGSGSDLSFENYSVATTTNTDGAVTKVLVTFHDFEYVGTNSSEDIICLKYGGMGDVRDGVVSADGTDTLSFTPAEPLEAGEYTLLISAEAMYGADESYVNHNNPDDIYVDFTVEEGQGGGSGQDFTFNHFEVNTTENEAGAVTQVQVTFTGFPFMSTLSKDDIYCMKNDDTWAYVQGTIAVTYNDNNITFTPNSPITAGGEYLLVFPAGSICGYDDSWSTEYPNNDDVVARFNVAGSDEPVGDLMEFTATPAEGKVTSLKDIVLEFPNCNSMDINDSTGVSVIYNGDQNLDVNPLKATGKKVTISLKDEQTLAGEYRVIIAAEAICAYSSNDYLDNPDPIVLLYNIEGESEVYDFSFTTDPDNSEYLASIDKIDFTFPNLDYISCFTENVKITLGETEITDYSIISEMNKLKLTFGEALTAEDGVVNLKVVFPAGCLSGSVDGGTAANANNYQAIFKLAPALRTDVTLALNSATKPNENNEISLNKQISAFFFLSPEPNLIPTEGTEHNVTIKQDEGEFEASARLAQAYGWNIDTTSYFMADFGKEPEYNGPYTVTVDAEAFCDEVWMANHNFGRVNQEIVFHFNIVDGKTSGLDEVEIAESKKCEIYTIDGIRLYNSVEDLPAGLYIINGKKVSIK
ncbi:MAG: hypothetical protein ACI4AK_04375 [Lepagella sp.]